MTDADHEWRAVREFSSAGFSVVPAPIVLYVPHRTYLMSYVPNTLALARSSAALYELLGNAVRVGLERLDLRRQTP